MRNVKIILLMLSCSVVYGQTMGDVAVDRRVTLIECSEMEYTKVIFPEGKMSMPKDVLEKFEEVKQISDIDLAVKKAERLVETFAAHRGRNGNLTRASFLPYVRDLVEYCYYIAEIKKDPGFASTWYWALVYGMSNFGLTCYGVAPGNCAGPFDVKKYPLVRDPIRNMQHHVQEQYTGWKRGYRGIDLCRYVMYPAAPMDWGNKYRRDPYTKEGLGYMKQFKYWDYAFSRCIQRGYEYGKLP